ncbi:MAG: hypothetical protein RR320_07440, partial [Oscillospiraceae bacterium]
WQFTEERGRRDYYWGRYFGTESDAVKNFLDRTKNYERQYGVHLISEGPQQELYKYYSTQRPVDLGTFPKSAENKPLDIINYDARIPVEGGAFRAWGELRYPAPLTQKQMDDYELRPAQNNPNIRREADVKRPIADQLKEAEKLAGENRGNPAPKKDAPDRGER